MKVGYVRVSTTEQNTARQEVMMEQLGVEKIFMDKASGRSRDARPGLEKMLDFIREGDVVVVESISRFARSTKDLLNLMSELKEKDVQFVSQKEKIDTSSPQGQFVLTVFGALAQLEADTNAQRQREGIEIAKAEGKYKGRTPIKIEAELFNEIHKKWYNDEITTQHAMKQLGLSRSTFYRRMWEYEKENGFPQKGKGRR
jgi:DNA invertase Pin-like site-specific DNA recombinase